jgi:hypothetical protein
MLPTFSILHEQGGVITADKFILTESFDWLRHIQPNININEGTPDTEPQVVGLYSSYYSSPLGKTKQTTLPRDAESPKVHGPPPRTWTIVHRHPTQNRIRGENHLLDV